MLPPLCFFSESPELQLHVERPSKILSVILYPLGEAEGRLPLPPPKHAPVQPAQVQWDAGPLLIGHHYAVPIHRLVVVKEKHQTNPVLRNIVQQRNWRLAPN